MSKLTIDITKMAPKVLGYRLLVLTICLLPLFIGLAHDILRPYALTPDADLIYLGQALRLGDGKGQTYFDHTGHSYILLLFSWLRFWAFCGLIPTPSEMIAITSPNIDTYIQPLIVAGRFLSVAIGVLFSVLVIWGARCLQLSPSTTLAIGSLFAVSQGLTAQTLIMRAELLSAMGTFVVFFALVRSQSARGWAHVFWLGLVGAASIIALDAKVQAVIVLLGLPLVALGLGIYRKPSTPLLEKSVYTPALVLFAISAGIPFLSVIVYSMFDNHFGGPLTGYQVLVPGLILGCLLCYGFIYKEPTVRQINSAFALLAGFSVGASVLFIWHDYRVTHALVHFFEHLAGFSPEASIRGISDNVLSKLLTSAFEARLATFPTPTGVLEILSLIISCILLGRGEKNIAFLIFLILGFAFVIQLMFGFRGYLKSYYIYVELWLILSACVGFHALLALNKSPKTGLLSLLIVAYGLWSASISLKEDMVPRQPYENVCKQAKWYLEPNLAIRFSHYCAGEQSSAIRGLNSTTNGFK